MSNKPKFRFNTFAGFTEEWKSNSFSTIAERVSKQSNSNYLPKLEFEDIISGEGRLNKDISKKFDNRKGIIFEPGYILFGKLRPYLKNWFLPKFNGIALGDFWVFTTKYSPEFVYSLIQTSNFQSVANLSTGTKMPRSDWKTVSTTDFLIPAIEEQKKIGSFFKDLDDTIFLYQQELDTLKQTKQGFLQKMLPKNGETEPVIRFKDFTKPWILKNFEMICESFEYGLNASAKEFDGTNQYLRITDIDDESRTFLKSHLTSPDCNLNSAEKYLLQDGDLLFARTGASVGKTYLYREKDGIVYYAGFLIRGKIKEIYDSEFVFQNTLTSNFKEFIKISSQRSGQPGINAQEIATYSFLVPGHEEQIKIGEFFRQLDEVIDLKEEELEALKQTKKGFLQKMFV